MSSGGVSSKIVSQRLLDDMLLQDILLRLRPCRIGRSHSDDPYDLPSSFRIEGCAKCNSIVGSMLILLDFVRTLLSSRLPDRDRQIEELLFSQYLCSSFPDRFKGHNDIRVHRGKWMEPSESVLGRGGGGGMISDKLRVIVSDESGSVAPSDGSRFDLTSGLVSRFN